MSEGYVGDGSPSMLQTFIHHTALLYCCMQSVTFLAEPRMGPGYPVSAETSPVLD